MSHRVSLLLMVGLLAGCPYSPDGAGGAAGPGAGGPGAGGPGAGGPGAGGPGGSGAEGDGPGAPGAVPPGDVFDLSKVTAQQTQAQILAEEHVTITGVVEGECTGTLRIDVITGKPGAGGPGGAPGGGSPGSAGGPPGPITILSLDAPGPFQLVVPKDAYVDLAALCDNDKDNIITPGTDKLSEPHSVGQVTADVSGVTIVLADPSGMAKAGGPVGVAGAPPAGGDQGGSGNLGGPKGAGGPEAAGGPPDGAKGPPKGEGGSADGAKAPPLPE